MSYYYYVTSRFILAEYRNSDTGRRHYCFSARSSVPFKVKFAVL